MQPRALSSTEKAKRWFYSTAWVKAALVLLCGALPFPTHAQEAANNETPQEESAWERELVVGFNYAQGNTDTNLLNTKVNIANNDQKNLWAFSVEGGYGEEDNETNVDYTTGELSFRRVPKERWYFGGGASATRDEPADITYRAIPEAFLGYFLIRDKKTKLSVDAGPSVVFEEVSGVEDSYFAPRIAQAFEYKLESGAKIYEKTRIVFSAEDSDNFLWNSEIGLSALITSGISLNLAATNLYDNEPAEDKKKNDFRLVTGLGVTF